MMRSMFTGVSGLRVHQTKMDVIANNIANVNTNGYKSSRATFSEIFAQTTSNAAGANADVSRGGINAMQIGLGTNLNSVDMLMTQGAAQRTDNPFDIFIEGSGFFVVSDATGTYFTRAGAFDMDSQGFLVNKQGLILNGWKADTTSRPGVTTIEKTQTKPIQITGTDEYMPPRETNLIEMQGNLNAIKESTQETTISFYDSIGNEYYVPVRYVYEEPEIDDDGEVAKDGFWRMEMANYAYLDNIKSQAYEINFWTENSNDQGSQREPNNDFVDGERPRPNENTGSNPTVLEVDIVDYVGDNAKDLQWVSTGTIIGFTENGILNPSTGEGSEGVNKWELPSSALQLFINGNGKLKPNAKFGDPVTVTFKDMTQLHKNPALSHQKDGNSPGDLREVGVDPNGIVFGQYSNGLTKELWQISLAEFKNPMGLERIGQNLYRQTMNSGLFDGVGQPAGGSTKLLGGVLEMSNVDLAQEFTEMITTQRGFQANSRTITTSDDMLQELVNLKR